MPICLLFFFLNVGVKPDNKTWTSASGTFSLNKQIRKADFRSDQWDNQIARKKQVILLYLSKDFSAKLSFFKTVLGICLWENNCFNQFEKSLLNEEISYTPVFYKHKKLEWQYSWEKQTKIKLEPYVTSKTIVPRLYDQWITVKLYISCRFPLTCDHTYHSI